MSDDAPSARPVLLTYARTTKPFPVQVSESSAEPSIASLTIVVSCSEIVGSATVAQIVVSIPSDEPDTPPDSANLAATPPTKASITSSGPEKWLMSSGTEPGSFTFTPKGGPVEVSAQSITITVPGIQVSALVGTAQVAVSEWAAQTGAPPEPSAPASGVTRLAVPKFPPDFALTRFDATPPAAVGPDFDTVISWAGNANATYTLKYGDVVVPNPKDPDAPPLPPRGSLPVRDLEDDPTIFILTVEAEVDGQTVTVHPRIEVPVERAHISKFLALPETMGKGATTTLSWVTNGEECTIRGEKVDAPSGTMPLTLEASADLTLTARRGKDYHQETRHITVVPPLIDRFQALVNGAPVAGPVEAGTVVTLVWATRYAQTVAIDQGIGPVAAASDAAHPRTVTVRNSTTFTLTTTGLGNPVTQAVRVAVYPVRIDGFMANPAIVMRGQPLHLTWWANRATAASIDSGVGNVDPGGGQLTIPGPAADTNYTLRCEGPDGPVTAVAQVRSAPRVDELKCTQWNSQLIFMSAAFVVTATIEWRTANTKWAYLAITAERPIGPQLPVPGYADLSGQRKVQYITNAPNRREVLVTLSAEGDGPTDIVRINI